MSREFTRDYGLEVARGNVSGITCINKFGRNIEVDAIADVWDGGQATSGVSLVWVAPTSRQTHAIASTSGLDDAGNVGATSIRIYGLPDWDTAEVNEDITMDGANPVTTSNKYVIIHRMHTLTSGGTSINAGIITATASTDSTVTAQIRVGIGQTGMAIYGIPSTQNLYLSRLYANMNRAAGAGAGTGYVNVSLLVNREPSAQLTRFLTKHTFGLSLNGTSALTIPYINRKKIEGPAIIKVQIDSGTANMDMSAGFDGYLITES